MRFLLVSFIIIFFTFICGFVHANNNSVIDFEEISTKVEKTSLTTVEASSRNATVKVITDTGYGSGIYVTINGRNVIFTAAHVVRDSKFVMIEGINHRTSGSILYIDKENDFAVIGSRDLQDRSPVVLQPYVQDMEKLIGEKVNYSGYPNNHDLLTIRGSVAGTDDGCIIVQSYAWMGASGSGVFDSDGRLVGILTAVDVGSFRQRYQVVEAIVWVIPIRNIDMNKVKESL